MMKFFGAGKPINSVDYYKGDQKRSDTFDGEKLASTAIIDIDRELFVNIDHKRQEYTQMTFEEWRQMFEQTMKDLKQDQAQEESETKTDVKWDIKVDVKETGAKEQIEGRPTDQVIITLDVNTTVTAQEEGKAPETAKANLIVTSSQWMFKGDDSAQKEMMLFSLKMIKKLGIAPDKASMQQMMHQVFESYPQLGAAMEKLQKESDKLGGVAMRVESLYESKADPQTAQAMKEGKKDKESTEIPTSVGGLVGGLGKKMLNKQLEKKQEHKDRTTLLKSKLEVTDLTTSSLGSGLFEIPASYKLVKPQTK
ncbi:MAG: hypothetical protein EHM72_17110 [Calditrichaeota bacterium]|nr:MAG: hypothetical protein EHM72_17110 [Calditrichota bacterium]